MFNSTEKRDLKIIGIKKSLFIYRSGTDFYKSKKEVEKTAQ